MEVSLIPVNHIHKKCCNSCKQTRWDSHFVLFALLFKHFPTIPATCHTPYFTNVCLIKDLEASQDKEINFSLFMYVIFIQYVRDYLNIRFKTAYLVQRNRKLLHRLPGALLRSYVTLISSVHASSYPAGNSSSQWGDRVPDSGHPETHAPTWT